MPYPEQLCAPLRQEMIDMGFTELIDGQQVDATIPLSKGTLFLVINSVCGCAAAAARPAVKIALSKSDFRPDHLYTVFAGQDVEATSHARKLTLPYPPSSPSFALFKDGQLVHFIERYLIEIHSAEMISENLIAAFEEFCEPVNVSRQY